MTNESTSKHSSKGINAFSFLYYGGLIMVSTKLIQYGQWIFQLIKNWSLPEEPFFSKIMLLPTEAQFSPSVYLVYALLYILFYSFIVVGFFQLDRAIKLLSKQKIFIPEVHSGFKRAARSFLIYVIGTFLVDFVLLLSATTSRPILSLFTTETIVFTILGYLLLFLADILKEGIALKQENELTI